MCCAPRAATVELPELAIIVDDIGYTLANSRSAIELQHPFAYAILPFSPHADSLANLATRLDKEVIIHLPMEAESGAHRLGPAGLRADMSREDFHQALAKSLAAVPNAIGVNNHMGSRLTKLSTQMRWLMAALYAQGDLFFVDSRTTSGSVASRTARELRLPSTSRDVFIDNKVDAEHIERQLTALVQKAKSKGRALGIAHPYDVTIAMLASWQPEDFGVRLIKLSDYVQKASAANQDPSLSASPPKRDDKRDEPDSGQYPYAQWQWAEHARRLR